jgi:hypothetical protein
VPNENRAVLIGGFDGQKYLNVSDHPSCRFLMTCGHCILYLVVWMQLRSLAPLQDVYVFELQTQTWTKLRMTGEVPEERAGHAVATFTGLYEHVVF